eukprot:TRINITY_DN105768_c0_g1_i1.p1 TRINITY_DN105768_c0_g1~~TRINITY_DN105768_c0_g1_i1.p1  ORF type:complete len:870 (+),score=238.62 TRINITY_DN105768_c0_g1_i1:74-2683(+)
MPSVTCPPALAAGVPCYPAQPQVQATPSSAWPGGSQLPAVAAQAAQAAKIHGAAAAHAAQTAQAHVHAAQAAHALASQAAQAQMRASQLQQQLQQPQPLSNMRCLSARQSRENLYSPAVQVQTQGQPWSFTAQPPAHVQAARQYSSQTLPGQATPAQPQQFLQACPHSTPVQPRRSQPPEAPSAQCTVEPRRTEPARTGAVSIEAGAVEGLLQQQGVEQKQQKEKLHAAEPTAMQLEADAVREQEQKLQQAESDSLPPSPPPQRPPAASEEAAATRPSQVPDSMAAAGAAEALRAAVRGGELGALRAALPKAVAAGSSWEVIEWAQEKCREMEQEDWATHLQRRASIVLGDEMQRTAAQPDALDAACERAWEAGVQGEILDRAREETGRRQLRQSAEEALLAVLADRTAAVDSLKHAVQRAEKAGVHNDLLSHARRRLEDLQEQTQKQQLLARAEQRLEDQMLSGSGLLALEAALEEALEAGVRRKALEKAWQQKAKLETQAWQAQKTELASQRPSVVDVTTQEVLRTPSEAQAARSGQPKAASVCASSVSTSTEDLPQTRIPQEAETPGSRTSTALLDDSKSNALDPESSPAPSTLLELELRELEQQRRNSDAASAQQAQGRRTLPPHMPAEACPPAAPRQNPTARGADLRSAEIRSGGPARAVSLGQRRPSRPSPAPSPRPEREVVPIYGLDAELKAKAAAKYDTNAEEDAAQWVEAVTGHKVIGNFAGALRSGGVLCDLVNCIRPGTIPKVNPPGMPFKERENIGNFLKVCRAWGVQEFSLFSTDDLYDEKNMMSVVNCIFAFGGAVQRTVREFPGPHFGVADTSNAKRDMKRDLGLATQTGGLHGPLERSHVDVTSNQIVRGGGC